MRLKTRQFEVWVEMEDGSRFLVRELPSSKRREITGRNGDNPAGYVYDAYAYQFKDWQNVKNEDGQEIPYSKDALGTAIEHDLEGLNEVMDRFRKLRQDHTEAVRAAEKN